MPPRHRNHLIEDESRLFFKQSLPEEWVCRDKPNDYGIDCEVEIFNEMGYSTGLVFWVQLKGTDYKVDRQIKNLSFSNEKISQFLNYDIPVLIIRYSTYRKAQYYKWAKSVDFTQTDNKSSNVKFFESEIWTDNSPSLIKIYLENQRLIKRTGLFFPIRTYVNRSAFNSEEDIPYANISVIKQCLSYFTQYFDLRTDFENSSLVVMVRSDGITVSLSDLAVSRMNITFNNLDVTHYSILSKYILVTICQVLYDLDKGSLAESIVINEDLFSIIKLKKDYLLSILPNLLKGEYSTIILDELNKYFQENKEDNLVAIATQIILISSKFKLNEKKVLSLQRFLHIQLDIAKDRNDDRAIASSSYNLGSFYRNIQNIPESIYHYLNARRFDENYKKQAYYYYEIAGVLFLMERYYFSSRFYAKSIELKTDYPYVKATYAHSLIFLGKYESALEQIDSFLHEQVNNEHVETDEWHLWYSCLQTLIEHGYPKSQIRNKKAAEEMYNAKEYQKAISYDLLDGDAWFNDAVQETQLNNPVNAFLGFTFSALLNNKNVEAWINATLCGFTGEVELLLQIYLIRTAFHYHEYSYVNNLYNIIRQNEPHSLNQITELIDRTIPYKKKEPFIIRIQNEDGSYEKIEE